MYRRMKLVKNDPVRNPHCMDWGSIRMLPTNPTWCTTRCGAQPILPRPACFVWGAVKGGLVASYAADFRPYALSAFDAGMPVSERLTSRMRNHHAPK
jgi:hypothetical protein